MATSTRRGTGPGAARSFHDDEVVPDLNLAVIRGRLSSDPTARTLPSGEVVHGYEVTVREEGQPATTVPVVVMGGPAVGLVAGDGVVVVGRTRRRFFRAGGATASRTELVADTIVPERRRAARRRALAGAGTRLADGIADAD